MAKTKRVKYGVASDTYKVFLRPDGYTRVIAGLNVPYDPTAADIARALGLDTTKWIMKWEFESISLDDAESGIGETQCDLLHSLREHEVWPTAGPGWVWDTEIRTGAILRALAKRGLVYSEGRVPTMRCRSRVYYRLSPLGKACLDYGRASW